MVTPAAPDQAERNRIAYEANRAEHAAAERFKCPSALCLAEIGAPCTTAAGLITQHPHRGRQKLSGYEPSATSAVQAVAAPSQDAGRRDVLRQALDLRDRPRHSPTDILVGAAIENVLGKLNTIELQAIVSAASALGRATGVAEDAKPSAAAAIPELEPPF